MDLSEEQQEVFDQVIDAIDDGDQQITIGGYAGTGKTVLATKLFEHFHLYLPCAPTGKAAHVLRQKGIEDAHTIHGTIYWPPPEEPKDVSYFCPHCQQIINGELGEPRPCCHCGKISAPPAQEKQEKSWVRRQIYELGKDPKEAHNSSNVIAEGFLADESSMISREVYQDITSYGLPCIFIGDHGQLSPVGDDVFLMEDPRFRLETIHRNSGPISHFAKHIREGNPAARFRSSGPIGIYRIGTKTSSLMMEVDQIICGYNRTRIALNQQYREQFGRKDLVEIGERVICLRNEAKQGLFNGMQFEVTAVYSDVDKKGIEHFYFNLVDDEMNINNAVEYDPLQFGKKEYEHSRRGPTPFDYAYCITCHKAQGSEWDRVMVHEQWVPEWGCRWPYTAASRAKKEVVWVLPSRWAR